MFVLIATFPPVAVDSFKSPLVVFISWLSVSPAVILPIYAAPNLLSEVPKEAPSSVKGIKFPSYEDIPINLDVCSTVRD